MPGRENTAKATSEMIAGVDGYTHRSWIAAIELADRSTKVELIESFGALLHRDELTLIVIDVPIGLLDVGSRRCDVIARKLVGRRRSSVYPAPIRKMLGRPQGRDERLALLVRQFPDIHRQTGVLALPAAGADVVDAYALLWTARRVRDGTARVIPDSPQYDGRGLRVEMVA